MPNYLRPTMVGALLLLNLLMPSVKTYAQDAKTGELQAWYDDSGKKIEAKYVGFKDGKVQLQGADGQQFNVPFAKLSLSGQLRVKKIVTPRAFDAPPLPSSFAPPPVSDSPFPSDPTIEQFLDVYYGQLKAGKADVEWHALPASVKADIEAVVVRAAEVLGPRTFKQLQAILPNVMTIVHDKRSFIVGVPAIARQPEAAKAINQVLPAVEPLVEVLTKPATWNSENFKPGKVGPWLMMFANDSAAAADKMLPVLQSIMPPGTSLPNPKDATYKVLEKTADTAKVEVSAGKEKVVVTFKKMEGMWVSNLTEPFFAQVTVAKNFLQNMDQAAIDEIQSTARFGLSTASGVLGSLAKAKTQQEFNSFIEPWINQAMAGMPRNGSGQPRQGMAGGPGGMSNSMSGPGGMDSSMSGGSSLSGSSISGGAMSGPPQPVQSAGP